MSYRCDNCGALRVGKELKRTSEIRNVEYDRMFIRVDRKTKKTVEKVDSVYNGTEIVEEQRLCGVCWEELKDVEPKVEKEQKIVKFVGSKKRYKPESNRGRDEKPDFEGLKKKFENKRRD